MTFIIGLSVGLMVGVAVGGTITLMTVLRMTRHPVVRKVVREFLDGSNP
jgi:hypothetical protein